MNLKSIEYFLAAAEEMNITRAAEKLFISQQALSSHLKRLEEEYGVPLFERRPALRLTMFGEQMAFYGRQIIQAEANMRGAFSDISKNHRGTLRLGISRLRGKTFFPVIWDFYHASHPNISIELIHGNSNTFEDLLQSGKIDLYIGVDVVENANREIYELTRERVQCCFSEELLKSCYPEEWEQILDSFKHGAGLLSPVVCWKNYHAQRKTGKPFHVFPVINEIPDNTVSLVYRKDYPLPEYARDFIRDAGMVFQNYSRSIHRHFG